MPRKVYENKAECVNYIREIQLDAALKFGEDLLEWMQEKTEKSEHCCVTGDCPHESQVECWQKLVADCLEETQDAAELLKASDRHSNE